MSSFAVILPIYGFEKSLEFSIRSCLGQTFKNFELHCVFDGYNQKSIEIVKKFSSIDSRVKIHLFDKAPGIGYENRNKVIRNLDSEFICFLSQDNIYFPNHLDLMLEEFFSRDIKLVYTRPTWINPAGDICVYPFNLLNKLHSHIYFNEINLIPLNNFCVRTETLIESNLFPPDGPPAGDWLLFKSIIKKLPPKSICVSNKVSVFHFRSVRRNEEQKVFEQLNKFPKDELDMEFSDINLEEIQESLFRKLFIFNDKNYSNIIEYLKNLQKLFEVKMDVYGFHNAIDKKVDNTIKNEIVDSKSIKKLGKSLSQIFKILNFGHRELRSPNSWFDESWYKFANPDVAEADVPGIVHYMNFGHRELRSPNTYD